MGLVAAGQGGYTSLLPTHLPGRFPRGIAEGGASGEQCGKDGAELLGFSGSWLTSPAALLHGRMTLPLLHQKRQLQ